MSDSLKDLEASLQVGCEQCQFKGYLSKTDNPDGSFTLIACQSCFISSEELLLIFKKLEGS